MNYLKNTWLLMGCLAVMLLPAPEAGALVIFSDDFDPDQDPMLVADIGTYAAGTDTIATSGYLQTFGSAGHNQARGVATQLSPAGTQLQWDWDWRLLSADSGIQNRPIAGLTEDLVGTRAVGLWVRYIGPVATGDLFYEAPGENWTDSGIDVPVNNGFEHWTLNYTVGQATYTLSGPGFSNAVFAVEDPASSIVGPWALGNGTSNSQWDNFVLQVIPEPTSVALLGLGVCLALVRPRRDG